MYAVKKGKMCSLVLYELTEDTMHIRYTAVDNKSNYLI